MIRVRDGDTLVVAARIWVGQEIVIDARINGIDAPELRARCPRERALAQRAREAWMCQSAIFGPGDHPSRSDCPCST